MFTEGVEQVDDNSEPQPSATGLPVIVGFVDLQEIGRGGFSTVYSATQLDFDRRVAIKVLDLSGAEARRIEREARAVGRMTDLPNVVQAFQVVSTADGRPCLVMALMPGSLSQLIASKGPASASDVARWAAQLTRALEAAHSFDLYHRDVKPQNVLISAYGDAYLADFGLAALDDMSAGTATAESLSPTHAPPERWVGDRGHQVAGDIYSLASTLYTALTGRTPFGTSDEGGVYGLLDRVMNHPLPQDPHLSSAVYASLSRAMSKEPDHRYRTVREFGDDIVEALVGSSMSHSDQRALAFTPGAAVLPTDVDDRTRVRPAGTPGSGSTFPPGVATSPVPPEEPPTTARRRRWPIAVAIVVLLVLIGGGVAAALLLTGDGPALPADQVAAGRSHTCARQPTGQVVCWGANWYGQSGWGDPPQPAASEAEVLQATKDPEFVVSDQWSDTPRTVEGLSGVTEVTTGRNHSCALTDTNEVWCWGANTLGQLGTTEVRSGVTDPSAFSAEPIKVAGLPKIAQVSAGYDFTCSLDTAGGVECWGSNWNGALGDPTVPAGEGTAGSWSPKPVKVALPTGVQVVSIAAGANHICAVTDTSTALCWGANFNGQLGNESVPISGNPEPARSATPVAVQARERAPDTPLTGVSRLAAGGNHTCAVLDTATVQCWGSNKFGQLGNSKAAGPDNESPWVLWPVLVVGVTAVQSLAAGDDTSCVVLNDGSISCWGANPFGQLGTPPDDPEWTAVPTGLDEPDAATQVAVGQTHVCAVTDQDQSWCWGLDVAGQNGATESDETLSQPAVVRE